MSVGFYVDFSVHICHAFSVSRCDTDIMEKALNKAGCPVFNAALSSLVGIFMLAFSESYIFQSIWKSYVTCDRFWVASCCLLSSITFIWCVVIW